MCALEFEVDHSWDCITWHWWPSSQRCQKLFKPSHVKWLLIDRFGIERSWTEKEHLETLTLRAPCRRQRLPCSLVYLQLGQAVCCMNCALSYLNMSHECCGLYFCMHPFLGNLHIYSVIIYHSRCFGFFFRVFTKTCLNCSASTEGPTDREATKFVKFLGLNAAWFGDGKVTWVF